MQHQMEYNYLQLYVITKEDTNKLQLFYSIGRTYIIVEKSKFQETSFVHLKYLFAAFKSFGFAGVKNFWTSCEQICLVWDTFFSFVFLYTYIIFIIYKSNIDNNIFKQQLFKLLIYEWNINKFWRYDIIFRMTIPWNLKIWR